MRPAGTFFAERVHEHDCRNRTIPLTLKNRRCSAMKKLIADRAVRAS